MKAVILALLASIGYGISTPLSKVAFNKGMHPDGLALTYAIGLLFIATITLWQKGLSGVFPNRETVVIGLISGILCALAFKAFAVSLAIPTSLVTVIMVVVASYPIFSSSISLVFLKEMDKVILPRLIVGTLMTIAGVCLVSLSTRPQ